LSGPGQPTTPRPVVVCIPHANPHDDRRWRFSFLYWHEREYFGIGGEDAGWFAALFERLKIFSQFTVSEVLEKLNLRDKLRFHPVNWSAKNMPIQKKDLVEVPRNIRDGPEFELYQFQLSKATGRVIGFFDMDMVFHILLLDPLHNLQPSKDFNWRVRPTDLSRTPYQAIKSLVANTIQMLEAGRTIEEVAQYLRKGISIETPSSKFIVVGEDVSDVLTEAMQRGGDSCVEDLLIRIVLEGYQPPS